MRAKNHALYIVAALSGYTTQDVAKMIGVSSGRLRAYLRAGVLSPEKGERGELRFSFQDLLLLRKAEGLVSSRIPPHRVRRALQKLRAQLPETSPLTGVNLGSEGSSVVVQEGNTRWQVESGQVLLSFDRPSPVDAEEAPLSMLRARPAVVAGDSETSEETSPPPAPRRSTRSAATSTRPIRRRPRRATGRS